MGVINPGIWATRLMGKDAQPLQSVKTVVTAVLTVMSSSKNSQNKKNELWDRQLKLNFRFPEGKHELVKKCF
jgi:hypothetical protein